MIESFICSGCNLETWSQHDLSGKSHLECPAGGGYWGREAAQQEREADASPSEFDQVFMDFLRYWFCGKLPRRLR